MSQNTRKNENSSSSAWAAAGTLGAGAVVAGGLYWLLGGKKEQATTNQITNTSNDQTNTAQCKTNGSTITYSTTVQSNQPNQPHQRNPDTQVSSYVSDWIKRISLHSETVDEKCRKGQQKPPPNNPIITNLNSLLADIYIRYIQLKGDDFELHYKIFHCVFQQLHRKMKEVDVYYRKYSSSVQFAGSHYDNLRITKPDEFDMDIVIGLPLNLKIDPLNPAGSDIIIEPKAAGYVQLKMGVQFQKLPMRDTHEWQINKAAYEWKDESNYLLHNKFLDWFTSVVDKALKQFEVGENFWPTYYVDGVPYIIRKSASGPAKTIFIENRSRGFKLDVDLVPALKFPETRWPINKRYREIPPACSKECWYVVGKKDLNGQNEHDKNRSWRLALHNQERQLMHDSCNLRQAIRLIKKLRDAQGMKKIASYYVKTLFFWEIVARNDKTFWSRNNPATLFKLMVGKFHAALVSGNIPYFWNAQNNLIGNVDSRILFGYAAKLVPLMQILEQSSDYKLVARYVLTPEEFADYNAKFLHI